MPDEAARTRLQRVRRALRAAPALESREGLEALDAVDAAPATDVPALEERAAQTAHELHRIVDQRLDARRDLHELVRRIHESGSRGLKLLREDNENTLIREPDTIGALEAIIETDGSRPSFLIRNGEIDTASSPVGTWGNLLAADTASLRDAFNCVGRINNPAINVGFAGTGFLIQENLILTNRHVLQAIADKDGDDWKFRPKVNIDFGYEYRGIASQGRRPLRRVLFCGAARIGFPIDHNKLDLALIELAPAVQGEEPAHVLSVDAAPDWHESNPSVYTIGYPGSPGEQQYAPTLLEQLFQQTFGYKRCAPGVAKNSTIATAQWTTGHDSTTLGGNSGSLVLVAGRAVSAAALHYGGVPGKSGENWAHVLGATLDHQPMPGGKTLQDVLKAEGVVLVDRSLRDL
jgi:hypothetical protein